MPSCVRFPANTCAAQPAAAALHASGDVRRGSQRTTTTRRRGAFRRGRAIGHALRASQAAVARVEDSCRPLRDESDGASARRVCAAGHIGTLAAASSRLPDVAEAKEPTRARGGGSALKRRHQDAVAGRRPLFGKCVCSFLARSLTTCSTRRGLSLTRVYDVDAGKLLKRSIAPRASARGAVAPAHPR